MGHGSSLDMTKTPATSCESPAIIIIIIIIINIQTDQVLQCRQQDINRRQWQTVCAPDNDTCIWFSGVSAKSCSCTSCTYAASFQQRRDYIMGL